MRIAVVNWSARRAGGAEHYVANVIPALTGSGHAVALWAETDAPADREPIAPRDQLPTFVVRDLGRDAALSALRGWAPDVIYAHGLLSPPLEARVLDIAPAVFMVHGYYGTCISGAKSFQVPVARPCHRRFGPACFAQFYPRRCGGLNPVTMVAQYRTQRARLRLLSRYRTILTSSAHMRAEYLRHGLGEHQVRRVAFLVRSGSPPLGARRSPGGPRHLVFAGRMDRTKGGPLLLDAVAGVSRRLAQPLRLTLAGDGPARSSWERRAARLAAAHPPVSITFTGWLDDQRLGALFDEADLLVVPSVWPEPFGLVGPEAGLHGVPAAAFAVGGIPDWLSDGVNGFLAPGDPPRAAGLAEAIYRCLADAETHRRLREEAVRSAQRFSLQRHLHELELVLGSARAGTRAPA